ncbi:hypothetical protein BDI4_660071 [Burkholderia diffusa]|nr:hypothetical protein BDI4_660071 [Burkholderia diffusa]
MRRAAMIAPRSGDSVKITACTFVKPPSRSTRTLTTFACRSGPASATAAIASLSWVTAIARLSCSVILCPFPRFPSYVVTTVHDHRDTGCRLPRLFLCTPLPQQLIESNPRGVPIYPLGEQCVRIVQRVTKALNDVPRNRGPIFDATRHSEPDQQRSIIGRHVHDRRPHQLQPLLAA